MHLVDAHGGVEAVALPPPGHVIAVLPVVAGGIVHHRGGARGVLALEGEGVGLEGQHLAGGALDLELVEVPGDHAGDEELPHARGREGAHDVPAPVPVVEGAHHAHATRVGGPHREVHPGDAVPLRGVGAELLVEPEVGALGHEVDVQVAQGGAEPVGILHLHGLRAPAVDPEMVGEPLAEPRQHGLEDPLGVRHAQFGHHLPGGFLHQLHAGGPGREDPRLQARAGPGMEAEDLRGTGTVPVQEALRVKTLISHSVSSGGVRPV